MNDLQEYVPISTTTYNYEVPGKDEVVTVHDDRFHHILFGKWAIT